MTFLGLARPWKEACQVGKSKDSKKTLYMKGLACLLHVRDNVAGVYTGGTAKRKRSKAMNVIGAQQLAVSASPESAHWNIEAGTSIFSVSLDRLRRKWTIEEIDWNEETEEWEAVRTLNACERNAFRREHGPLYV